MKQIKFFLGLFLLTFFAINLSAQRGVNMGKIQMKATIAKDLQNVINNNKAYLKTLSSGDQGKLKTQWLEELRVMHGWYDADKKFDQKVREMKASMKKQNKYYVEDYNPNKNDLKNKGVVIVPRDGDNFEVIETHTAGIKPNIEGSFAIDFPDEIYEDIPTDKPLSKGILNNIRNLENKAIKDEIAKLIRSGKASPKDADLPSDENLKEISTKLTGLRTKQKPQEGEAPSGKELLKERQVLSEIELDLLNHQKSNQ